MLKTAPYRKRYHKGAKQSFFKVYFHKLKRSTGDFTLAYQIKQYITANAGDTIASADGNRILEVQSYIFNHRDPNKEFNKIVLIWLSLRKDKGYSYLQL
ncbi:MAG: hypothetical protein ACRD8Z_28975 [Nitrososphaeraceae archaeon]